MKMSDTISELSKALALAQGEMDDATKGAKNDHFKSKYADLAAVREVIREPLSKHGLAIVQFPRLTLGVGVEVETMLIHSSGEFLSETLMMPLGKQDAHGVGSAITYARRYGLMALLCLASEDDDGNTAAMNAKRDPDPTLVEEGNDIADGGLVQLQQWWASLSANDRVTLGPERLETWKSRARKADADSKSKTYIA